MTPRATMRLQFHKGFTFADAERQVPYLERLGISHVYASPITTARPGSTHGYDVIDPTRVNPELGGEDGLRRFVETLRAADLGLIVDIVPNHVAVGDLNPWWSDVLARGRESRYAPHFDIDWNVDDLTLRGKVLLPFLGKPYADAMAAGEVTLQREADGGFAAHYFQQRYPIAEKDYGDIERLTLSAFDAMSNEGCARLDGLLSRQHYRLALWRVAADEINWRRFFDVNELAGLRMEYPPAFEDVHALIFRLYADGLIDGVRVDHIDGLADPASYCRTLRRRLDGLAAKRPPAARQERAYVVIEKILLRDETLPHAWECDGTSGYDFMNEVSAVAHDPRGEASLGAVWAAVSGRSATFVPEEETARREIIARSFSAQLEACALAFRRLAQTQWPGGDLSHASIRRAISKLLTHFPVYRSYGTIADRPERDEPYLASAMQAAMTTCLPADRVAVNRINMWLSETIAPPELAALQTAAVTKFQQLSAPIAAKAVEDTAFYRYGRLLSRNDVGFDAERFSESPQDFHAKSLRRHADYPHAMLATATHDHKRGEDLRARLAVISEVHEEWARVLPEWIERCRVFQHEARREPALSGGDMAMLLQMIVGAWPLDLDIRDAKGCAAFANRLAQWQQKALREAKLETDWVVPNEAYETTANELLMSLVARDEASDLLADIVAFANRIAPAGAVNGLAQTLIKLTAPGVPDIYQGTEFWDFSLVDPDNRRLVDFASRANSLDESALETLTTSWRDGRIKQAVIARTLAVRRKHPALFAEGSYEPVEVRGKSADRIIAFERRLGDVASLTIAPRLVFDRLKSDGGITFDSEAWSDTSLGLADLPRRFINLYNGELVEEARSTIPVGPLLRNAPVALLKTIATEPTP